MDHMLKAMLMKIVTCIQIGEYVNRLSDEFKAEHDEMPWSDMIGMRIIHAHNYDSVIDEIVGISIQDEIPLLKDYLENIIDEFSM